jgi:aminopeptidase
MKTEKPYTPPQKILENYAKVLVNFALGKNEGGVKKGEVVRLVCPESAKPLFVEIRKAILRAGANAIVSYLPDNDDRYNTSRDFYELASEEQLNWFPREYWQAMINTIDHNILILAERNKRALAGIDPKKIMKAGKAVKPVRDMMDVKENAGKFFWTLALYGTPEMAREVGMTQKQYWDQIIKACFLKEKDPVKKWREVIKQIRVYQNKLNALKIEKLHIKGSDVDLHIQLGEKRAWVGGTGRNIPSFEIFTSPNWQGTNGWIKFNQPLYRYGNIIKGIELWFENGKVVKSKATQNEKVLKEMIATENADKVGEFSLTDSRFSQITKFMGETLFDENVGGKYGNTHIALGAAYHDCYEGDPSKVSKAEWERLGYNDSSVHTDIVSTANRTVTATLPNGKQKVIYKDGKFTL